MRKEDFKEPIQLIDYLCDNIWLTVDPSKLAYVTSLSFEGKLEKIRLYLLGIPKDKGITREFLLSYLFELDKQEALAKAKAKEDILVMDIEANFKDGGDKKMTEDFLKLLELARLHSLSYEVVNTFVRNLDNPEKVFTTMIEACADWDLI